MHAEARSVYSDLVRFSLVGFLVSMATPGSSVLRQRPGRGAGGGGDAVSSEDGGNGNAGSNRRYGTFVWLAGCVILAIALAGLIVAIVALNKADGGNDGHSHHQHEHHSSDGCNRRHSQGGDAFAVCSVSDPVRSTGPSRFTSDYSCLRAGPNVVGIQRGYEGENQMVVNPTNADNLVIVTHQDRCGSLGSCGNAVYASFDGGRTWQQSQVTLTRCQGPSLANSSHDFEGSSEPYVQFTRDGVAILQVISFNIATNYEEAVVVARSRDGGVTWSEFTEATRYDSDFRFVDRPTIQTDRFRPGNVYMTYTDFGPYPYNTQSPAVFQRSLDGGATWSAPADIPDLGARDYSATGYRFSWAQLMHVLPDRSLIAVAIVDDDSGANVLRAVRSTDQGGSWVTGADGSIFTGAWTAGVRDPDFGTRVRTMTPGAMSAINKCNGRVYAVWETPDGYTGPGSVPGSAIGLQHSNDGGASWVGGNASFVVANTHTAAQAFLPAVAVADDGVVGVLYADFRMHEAGSPSLMTDWWLALYSADVSELLGEVRLTDASFDMRQAPESRGSMYLGDYVAVQADGLDFVASFPVTNGPYGQGWLIRAEAQLTNDDNSEPAGPVLPAKRLTTLTQPFSLYGQLAAPALASGCGPMADVAHKIALIAGNRFADCPLIEKLGNAAAGGAVAVIVYDNAGDHFPGAAYAVPANAANILPNVYIDNASGQVLLDALASQDFVYARLAAAYPRDENSSDLQFVRVSRDQHRCRSRRGGGGGRDSRRHEPQQTKEAANALPAAAAHANVQAARPVRNAHRAELHQLARKS